MEYNNIIFEVKDRIAKITLNREEYANAMDHDTLVELRDAFHFCSESPDVSVVVLTGKGKNFSAGGNLKKFKEILDSGEIIRATQVRYAAESAWDIASCKKPTIAMINGAAAGMAASIACACDFRVFSPSTKFVMAFINVGLSGDTGCMYWITKLIGIAKAKEIIMTGRQIRAEEAKQFGLATIVAESDEKLEEATMEFAAKFANGPAFAYGKQKEIFTKIYYPEWEAYTEIECQNLELCSGHPDFKEAVYAFCEKRKPVFNK